MPRKATKEAEPQPAAAAQEEPAPAPAAAMAEAEVEELPKAIVRRLVKDKLAHVAGGGEGAEVIVNKDAMAAFAESARIFIHYLSATANDMCKESKRQTINADDVLKALDEMEFSEFVEPLRISLQGQYCYLRPTIHFVRYSMWLSICRTSLQEFRNKNADKRSEANKKQKEKRRKLNEESLPQKENDPADDAEENDD
ncbi:DNA polymerase epsilon subunit 3-like isoform X1 [Panicum virgatum]|uniref:DNA polymerase epsilon subunit 3-like isoform X1 n=1 Tax=Panicum virgatum TaxID=38727 RepID=UPI0019D66D4C|nr:DNA polymerase epsilon subunit 3-like isoform X1 [Panicum virgatum]